MLATFAFAEATQHDSAESACNVFELKGADFDADPVDRRRQVNHGQRGVGQRKIRIAAFDQRIKTIASDERIHSATTGDGVITATTVEMVGKRRADQDIVARTGEDLQTQPLVLHPGSIDEVIAIAALDHQPVGMASVERRGVINAELETPRIFRIIAGRNLDVGSLVVVANGDRIVPRGSADGQHVDLRIDAKLGSDHLDKLPGDLVAVIVKDRRERPLGSLDRPQFDFLENRLASVVKQRRTRFVFLHDVVGAIEGDRDQLRHQLASGTVGLKQELPPFVLLTPEGVPRALRTLCVWVAGQEDLRHRFESRERADFDFRRDDNDMAIIIDRQLSTMGLLHHDRIASGIEDHVAVLIEQLGQHRSAVRVEDILSRWVRFEEDLAQERQLSDGVVFKRFVGGVDSRAAVCIGLQRETSGPRFGQRDGFQDFASAEVNLDLAQRRAAQVLG